MRRQLSDRFQSVKVCFSAYVSFGLLIMAQNPQQSQDSVTLAHQEHTKLVAEIAELRGQLDSGEFGSVGTPAFQAKIKDLAKLYARLEVLAKQLGLPKTTELYRPPQWKH